MFRVLALLFIFGCLTATPNFAQLMQATPAAAVPAAAANSPATVRPPVRPREDWTKLPVDRTVLKPLVNGASLGKGDYQGYTRELIRLQWRSADPIDIYVVKPHGVEKPRVVLYLYSFPSDNDRFRDDGWCERATKEGMAAANKPEGAVDHMIEMKVSFDTDMARAKEDTRFWSALALMVVISAAVLVTMRRLRHWL